MNSDDLRTLSGYTLIAIFCGWAVAALSKQFLSNWKNRTVDQNLRERLPDDAPGLFFVEVCGSVLVIVAGSLLFIGAMFKLIQVLVRAG